MSAHERLAAALDVADAALELRGREQEYREVSGTPPIGEPAFRSLARRERAARVRDASLALGEALECYAAAKERDEERGAVPVNWPNLGRWFFHDATDEEIRGEISATFVALMDFENGEPDLPSPFVRYLREKTTRFEQELADREAERT